MGRGTLVLVAVLPLLGAACASAAPQADQDSTCRAGAYVLEIDPAFSEGERTALVESADAWADATEGALRFSVVTIDAQPGYAACTIRVLHREPADPETEWGAAMCHREEGRPPGSARAWLSPRLDSRPAAFRATAMHELGHAIGLDHAGADDMGSCLWKFITVGCDITPATRAKLCAVWGCDDGSETKRPRAS